MTPGIRVAIVGTAATPMPIVIDLEEFLACSMALPSLAAFFACIIEKVSVMWASLFFCCYSSPRHNKLFIIM